MQIVIDIPEKAYKVLKSGKGVDWLSHLYAEDLALYVINGTPLPKGHGDLIDAKQFEKDNKVFWNCDFNHPRLFEDTLKDLVKNAPTIIEADKSESEEV